jgi:hypothetical protein
MLQTLKTGKVCPAIRITLSGPAKKTFVPWENIDGLYKLDGIINDSFKWKHTKSGLFLFWDPKKEGSKGSDRSHWKVGTLINNTEIGYLDTYDTSPDEIFGVPYFSVYLWSFFTDYWPYCSTCSGLHWEPAYPEDGWIKLKCERNIDFL